MNGVIMFTRVPTFIPNESVGNEEWRLATSKSRKRASQRERLRRAQNCGTTETSRNRVPPLILPSNRAEVKTAQEKSNTNFQLNSKQRNEERGIVSYYAAKKHNEKEQIISELNKKAQRIAKYNEHSNVPNMNKRSLHNEKVFFTQPSIYTRQNKRFQQEITNYKAVEYCVPRKTLEGKTNQNEVDESILYDNKSSMVSPLPNYVQTNSNAHESSKKRERYFKSKIPIRFPEIRENKRVNPKKKNIHRKNEQTDTIFLPVIKVKSSKSSGDGAMTQSIADCQNMIKKDFKRLGENLESTFKLLQRYIECKPSTQTDNKQNL